MVSDAQSQASTSEAGRSAGEGSSREDDDVFEQRRVRHIASILLRNVEISVPSTASTLATLPRPRPRRSVSTASTSSAGTIRRIPSNKSIRSKARGRASSIASTHTGVSGLESSVFLTSDLSAVQQDISSRLSHTFVTLARLQDGKEVYRTCVSDRAGVNFEWGKTPGSIHDPDGLPLDLLPGELSAEESVSLAVWYRPVTGGAKGKSRESDRIFVQPGTESASGWSLLWQQEVHLKHLRQISGNPATSIAQYGRNTLILGLSFPMAEVQALAKDADKEADHERTSGTLDRKKVDAGGRGDQVYYYLAEVGQGNLSKVDFVSSTQTEAERRAVIRAKLKGGEMVRGYEVEDLLKLLQLQRELYQTAVDIAASQARSDLILESDRGPIAKELRCAEEEERLTVLNKEQDEVHEKIKMKRKSIVERTEGLNRRRARLEMARRAMAKQKASYVDMQHKLTLVDRQCASIRAKSYARRVSLLQQLEVVYPVELIDGATLLFGIVGVPLANRVMEEESGGKVVRQDDDTVSSALGLIGQVVSLMSVYLDTPIHYPIATAGSRSVIQDSISVMSGPRAFPLYAKGVEAYRFEYGIFLLNKNIEQLMNHFGITILDIRNTLPNLKNLLVTLSASSTPASRLSRRNLVGHETISLKANLPTSQAALPLETASTTAHTLQDGKGKTSTGWGMSLLGWGGVKESQGDTAAAAAVAQTASSSPVPTIRTLGAIR